jgi:hypothetical protein
MRIAPRTPCEDSNRQNECQSDTGDRSKDDRTFPVLTIPHAVHHVVDDPDSSCFGEQRQDTVGDVNGNDL